MEGMPIQKVQAITGLSAHTLRYYEKAGLMIAPITEVLMVLIGLY